MMPIVVPRPNEGEGEPRRSRVVGDVVLFWRIGKIIGRFEGVVKIVGEARSVAIGPRRLDERLNGGIGSVKTRVPDRQSSEV